MDTHRETVAEVKVELREGEYEWWSENEGHIPLAKNTLAPESSSEAGVPGNLRELELDELDLAPPSTTSILEKGELVLFSDHGESYCTYY